MDLISIAKLALPIIGGILLDENISPIKKENPYKPVIEEVVTTANNIVRSIPDSSSTIENRKNNINKTPYEIAKEKIYKYNF